MGEKMMWSLFNFKSPLGSLTEEYGNWKSEQTLLFSSDFKSPFRCLHFGFQIWS